MTRALVVVAHPEPRSFTHAWARASADAFGDLAETSDLYADGFDPVERGELYGTEGPFDPLKVQFEASRAGQLPEDLRREVDRIERADLLIFHFPIWWFGLPAMLKGWLDRALVHGAIHSEDARFDSGTCTAKRALFCVSTGCSEAECGPDGREGDLAMLLWPLAQTLRYCGFSVYEPVSTHRVHGYHEGPDKAALEAALGRLIEDQPRLLSSLETRPLWSFNRDEDFDVSGRLRLDAPSYSPFIRHRVR